MIGRAMTTGNALKCITLALAGSGAHGSDAGDYHELSQRKEYDAGKSRSAG